MRSPSPPDGVGLKPHLLELQCFNSFMKEVAKLGATAVPDEIRGLKFPVKKTEFPQPVQFLVIEGNRLIHVEAEPGFTSFYCYHPRGGTHVNILASQFEQLSGAEIRMVTQGQEKSHGNLLTVEKVPHQSDTDLTG